MSEHLRRVTRALLSVSDKRGLAAFARALAERGVELVSTGGTARALAAEGLIVIDVAELTGFPEVMDGRVKTLHPNVHGGLLAIRSEASHVAAMEAHGIRPIDLVAINLYPFEDTAAGGGAYAECVENIDIGGPAMIRAAAKNHADVAVVIDPADYDSVLAELDAHGGATTLALRQRLAAKAYARTAAYDAAIANWFAERLAQEGETRPPAWRTFAGRLRQALRYGENPHQRAAFYAEAQPRFGVATAEQLQGLELSYINILDADAAFELVAEFDPRISPAVSIIKHANPCGVATGATFKDAYARAVACDPVSRFGGIIALNGPLDGETAEAIVKTVTDVIIVPEADVEARALIAKRRNTRLLVAGGLPDPYAKGWTVRSVAGGLLVQTRDDANADELNFKVVTKRQPTANELADLKFAFRVSKHVKSNTIVYAKDGATVGIGAGQMSRVDSARIAAMKARDAAQAAGLSEPATIGSVAASDAFFPFADGLLAVAEAGATAVIQPGGAMRDNEVIAAADAVGLAMVFSGVRQFRH
jgi:phosphoribosylaminoimidazolecarboxamide formyltransferase / IMP cyclohydrolase